MPWFMKNLSMNHLKFSTKLQLTGQDFYLGSIEFISSNTLFMDEKEKALKC